MITHGYMRMKLKRVLDGYEQDQFLSINFDHRTINDTGVLKITISGIPKDDAHKIITDAVMKN